MTEHNDNPANSMEPIMTARFAISFYFSKSIKKKPIIGGLDIRIIELEN